MLSTRNTIVQWVSFLAILLIVLQIAFILFQGEAFCFNEGCRIVERLTTIQPLYLNLAGLLYFIVLFATSTRMKKRLYRGQDLPSLLLLLGLTVEGVLLSYQLFVVRTFCSYCLLILALVIILNLLYGWHQIRFALPLFAATLLSFAVLNFSPASLLAQRAESLNSGTYAVKKCDTPLKRLYFFFSADCPHCKNVLDILENCNNCEFHFNPIDKNQNIDISGLEYTPSYSPALNRVVLSMLNITTIPVLLVQNQDGLTFIKGEESITRFISQTCFSRQQKIQEAPLLFGGQEQEGTSFYKEEEGECAIEVECPDESELLLNPYNQ